MTAHALPASNAPLLLTLAVAAGQLGISERALRDHVHNGTIPTVKIGFGAKRPRYRIDPADLARFIQSRKSFEGVKCQSSSAGKTKPIISTSNAKVIDLREVRAQRTSAKRSGSNRSSAPRQK